MLCIKFADDRVNDYQHYALDAVQSCELYQDMGAQVASQENWIYITRLTVNLVVTGQLQWLPNRESEQLGRQPSHICPWMEQRICISY